MVTFSQFTALAKKYGFDLEKLNAMPFENTPTLRKDFITRLKKPQYGKNYIPYRCLLKLYLRWAKPEALKAEAPTNDRPCRVCGFEVHGNLKKVYCGKPCARRAAELAKLAKVG